jgi:hypothetical protein
LHNIAINIARESGNPRVDLLRKDIALDLGILDDTIFEFRVPSNIIVDAIKESNNTITNIVADSYNTISHKLSNSDNVLDIPSELIAIDILSTAELDLITSEFDIIDLDILGVKSRA